MLLFLVCVNETLALQDLIATVIWLHTSVLGVNTYSPFFLGGAVLSKKCVPELSFRLARGRERPVERLVEDSIHSCCVVSCLYTLFVCLVYTSGTL